MITIYWAGDSTVKQNSIATYPQTGIGQEFERFVRRCEVRVENYAEKYANTDLTTAVEGIGRDNTYELYLRAHEGAEDATEDVVINVADVAAAEGVEVRENGVFTANGSTAVWTVNVPQSGFYNIRHPALVALGLGGFGFYKCFQKLLCVHHELLTGIWQGHPHRCEG